MEHLSNDHKDGYNQHKNSHKQHDETGHHVVNIMESQWKLRQQYDQNFPMKAIVEQILASGKRNNSKRAGLRITARDLGRKVSHLSKVV